MLDTIPKLVPFSQNALQKLSFDVRLNDVAPVKEDLLQVAAKLSKSKSKSVFFYTINQKYIDHNS